MTVGRLYRTSLQGNFLARGIQSSYLAHWRCLASYLQSEMKRRVVGKEALDTAELASLCNTRLGRMGCQNRLGLSCILAW